MDSLKPPDQIRFRKNFIARTSTINCEDEIPSKGLFNNEEYKNCLKVLNAFSSNLSMMDDPHFHELRKLGKIFVERARNKRKLFCEELSKKQKLLNISEELIKENKKVKALRYNLELLQTNIQKYVNKEQRHAPLWNLVDQLEKLNSPKDDVSEISIPLIEEEKLEKVLEKDTLSQSFVKNLSLCMICDTKFDTEHFLYKRFCPVCASLNWEKRHQKGDLKGRIALVTGARVKIGYEIVLKLLRCGCRVIATTRFPRDAARRFAKEEDFHIWKDSLSIYGLDFRDLGSIERFITHIKQSFPFS